MSLAKQLAVLSKWHSAVCSAKYFFKCLKGRSNYGSNPNRRSISHSTCRMAWVHSSGVV